MEEEKHYLVRWEIDIWATDPYQAALQAREIQQDTSEDNIATIYDIIDPETEKVIAQIDTLEPEEEQY